MGSFHRLVPVCGFLSRFAAAVIAIVAVALGPISLARAQPPSAVAMPAGRAAKNVAIITMQGEINATVAASVKRRLNEAVAGSADAIVIEIDSPGGELGAVLDISTAIKQCKVANTVAWIRPQAFSGGAIVALACREIIVAESATFGDAAPIEIRFHAMLNTMGNTERAKALAPLLAEVVDSARMRGYDEKLVQGFVMLGVELWLIENQQTGEKLFVDRTEYKQLFESEPPVMTATLAAAVQNVAPPAKPIEEGTTEGKAENPSDGRATPGSPAAEVPSAKPAEKGGANEPTLTFGPGAVSEGEKSFIPASNQVTPALLKDLNLNLSGVSKRPVLRSADKANWKLVEYVSSGGTIYTLKRDQVQRYGLAAVASGKNGSVNDDEELKAFFGASALSRLEPSVFEVVAGFLREGLRGMIIRGLLITIFLVAAFIELTHPGMILPGAVAIGALALLVAPSILLGAGGWWQVAAVLGGISLLALEIFVFPGFGVPGVAGLLLLFAGLVGMLMPGGGSLFPGSAGARSDLLYGSITVVLSFACAIVVLFFVSKHLGRLPIINRMILGDARPDDDDETGMIRAMEPAEMLATVGEQGTVLATLRPSGRVQIGDRIVDVVSAGGMISQGAKVRVVEVDGFKVVVEALQA